MIEHVLSHPYSYFYISRDDLRASSSLRLPLTSFPLLAYDQTSAISLTFGHFATAPHTYISTQPFLPSQSPLSTTFSMEFTKAIKLQRQKLLSWPPAPLRWTGHTSCVACMCYSPNGQHLISGSQDLTIRIWDAETGAAVGHPLKGHTGQITSVAYSPDGHHIISGSDNKTI
jgi:WD40 repeat protein